MSITKYHISFELAPESGPSGRPLDLQRAIPGVHPVRQLSYKLIHILDPKVSEARRKFKAYYAKNHPADILVPGLEWIGNGYNIFGEYVSEDDVKRPLFDPAKMPNLVKTTLEGTTYSHWPIVTIHKLTNSISDRYSVSQRTASSYIQTFSMKADLDIWGFGGQFEADFKEVTEQSYYQAFVSLFDITKCFTVRLNDQNDLRAYLFDDVRKVIDDERLNPNDLFEEFGLYFLTGIDLGGRLKYVSHMEKADFKYMSQLESAANASLREIIGVKITTSEQALVDSFRSSFDSTCVTVGGDNTKGGGSIHDQASYQRWKDTIPNTLTLVDFTDKNVKAPLTPIWKLAIGKRREALKKAEHPFIVKKQQEFEGNHPLKNDRKSVKYEVTTYTSNANAAGTDARIEIELYGRFYDEIDVPPYKQVHDTPGATHDKGMIDKVTFGPTADLGELYSIGIHNNGGGKKGRWWKFDNIRVASLNDGKIYESGPGELGLGSIYLALHRTN